MALVGAIISRWLWVDWPANPFCTPTRSSIHYEDEHKQIIIPHAVDAAAAFRFAVASAPTPAPTQVQALAPPAPQAPAQPPPAPHHPAAPSTSDSR